MFDNTPNQPSKNKTKNCVEINGELRGRYNEDNQVRFKISILRSSLFDYGNVYMLLKGTITIENESDQDQAKHAIRK